MLNKNCVKDIVDRIISNTISYEKKSCSDICQEFNIISKSKQVNAIIVKKFIANMNLSIAEEKVLDEKILIKTTAFDENGKIKESMPLKSVNFHDIYMKDWDDSELYKFLQEKTFLLFIFMKKKKTSYFQKVIPYKLTSDDIFYVKEMWNHTKELIQSDNIQIGGKHMCSVLNFTKSTENLVSHIRPKAKDSSSASVMLPNGRYIINYAFWLNSKFIEKIILKGEKYEK